MKLVERHVIKKGHLHYQEIDRLCWASKNLYNYANYLIRQAFIHEGVYLDYYSLQKSLQSMEVYRELPAKVSQQILMCLDKNWKSFKSALAEWNYFPIALLCLLEFFHNSPFKEDADRREDRSLKLS